ncbi:efflux RND transporter permease subunit [Chitinophaga nivalis]|uniref:Efflux RND transporter permease subunit n=1 Tax=Chitinophaga nivalis TaxID=2991709 RepID=A0ABT3IVU0_9BACT|nr:efflux RND transporter permease subunit [Chitinophaga nivalis]MCW3462245.1 efflux RND transporter permease subunit [Chitinophaga nivalis]MCW3488063.1 efflux RND transporter permease subunit [Chitinophaga nivalis]
MNLIKTALQKPVAIVVMVVGLLFFGVSSLRDIKIDIFPDLNLPSIYVSQPYGGMSPQQMEGFIATNYQNLFLYVSGIKDIETKNIQGLTMLKLSFYEGTNMAQAAAEVTAMANRAFASMPAGTQPPFIIRFDASTLPIGQLALSSATRSNNELQDLAMTIVRPSFSRIAGLSSPAPFGGNSRTVLINVDPALMRSHHLTPDQIVAAVKDNNQISPAGNVRIGDITYLTPNNTVMRKVKDFETIPLVMGDGPTVYLKDVARVEDGADVTTSYAVINGKRSVYLPAIKTADASTWTVVKDLKAALPNIQKLLPEDVKVSFEFDQSTYVINAVKSLVSEGAIGAVLTGLMVLLFLGDKRSAFIVILTIPVSILIGVMCLKLAGQTINIMTLSGLALAIGILVDMATVTIENIHQHLEMGKPKAKAILDACREIAFPELLILFCILAVFAPSFTMRGVPRAMFLPLSLAIGFSMIAAYLLAQTLVPILANWILKADHFKGHTTHHATLALTHEEATDLEKDLMHERKHPAKLKGFEKFKMRFLGLLESLMRVRKGVVIGYLGGIVVVIVLCMSTIGRDILPKLNNGQFQLRLKAPEGTRIERSEAMLLKGVSILKEMVGEKNIEITSSFIGTHPSSYSTNPIYLFMAGPNEAVMQVNLKEDYKVNMDDFKEKYRKKLHQQMPEVKLSFEPIDLTDKVMSQGAATPVEVAIMGKNLAESKPFAEKVLAEMKKIPYLRDVQINQPLNYPAIRVNIDRERAGQLGVSVTDIAKSLTAATSSSRFTEKNVWLDEKNATSYFVQISVPENQMSSMNDMAAIPVSKNQTRPFLGDVATLQPDTVIGEYDRVGAVRIISIGANVHKKDLGRAADAVDKAIKRAGEPPRGMSVEKRGLMNLLTETLDSLQSGLLVAIIVILLLLAANFQSFKVALVIVSTIPAVLAGSLIMLLLTGSTLNLQSYMGIIMSVGVSVANAILLVTNAEKLRLENSDARKSALESAAVRLRPILMTSIAMVVGMIPMASGLGEAGDQTAPLGRAVIGGLIASTFASLLILPLIFSWVQRKATVKSASLDPEDKNSEFYIPDATHA